MHLAVTAFTAFALSAFMSGCDLGARDDSPAHGPGVHVVATYPADGQGTAAALTAEVTCDVATPDCPVPTDLAIELRFDRFLRPSGALDSGARLYTGSRANTVALSASYDLVERAVVLRPSRPLQPHALYTVELSPGADQNHGFWAFDGAPLEPGPVPLRFGFTTGAGPRAEPAPPTRPLDTCQTMTQGPFGTCSGCHVTQPGEETRPPSKYPPMGLDLSSNAGLFYTAVSQVAHQTETGNGAIGEGLREPSRFGVQMKIVDPGNPGTSYLMYKLLQKPENFQLDTSEASCVTAYHSPVADGSCTPPDESERIRLREWFVRGDPMPEDTTVPLATTHANLVRIAAWIATGALCADPARGAP